MISDGNIFHMHVPRSGTGSMKFKKTARLRRLRALTFTQAGRICLRKMPITVGAVV